MRGKTRWNIKGYEHNIYVYCTYKFKVGGIFQKIRLSLACPLFLVTSRHNFLNVLIFFEKTITIIVWTLKDTSWHLYIYTHIFLSCSSVVRTKTYILKLMMKAVAYWNIINQIRLGTLKIEYGMAVGEISDMLFNIYKFEVWYLVNYWMNNYHWYAILKLKVKKKKLYWQEKVWFLYWYYMRNLVKWVVFMFPKIPILYLLFSIYKYNINGYKPSLFSF